MTVPLSRTCSSLLVLVGVAVGVCVGVAAGGLVGVAVGVCVGVAVGVCVGVAVGVCVGVAVGVCVGVAVGVCVGVAVGVCVGVAVGVCVGVAVGVGVGLAVGCAVGVADGVCVGAAEISLAARAIVAAGVAVCSVPSAHADDTAMAAKHIKTYQAIQRPAPCELTNFPGLPGLAIHGIGMRPRSLRLSTLEGIMSRNLRRTVAAPSRLSLA